MMEFEKIHSETLNETLYRTTHKSGLKIYVLPKKGHNKSYASFSAQIGSVDNKFIAPGDKMATQIPDGVAHFLEHKLFEQQDGGNAFDKYSKTGASANAYTSFNLTAYIFSTTNAFYDNLEILLDFVDKPYFTAENVAKEQGIIAQEIRMYDDDPSWRVFFNLLRGMYVKHPVRNDIAGTVESISEITADVLYKCYNTFYNPSNMMLFICGDVIPEKIEYYADKYVTAKPAGVIERLYPDEPAKINKDYIEQKLSVASPIFLLGFKDAENNLNGADMHKKQIITEVLLEMLLGKGSMIYNELYEQGLINDRFEAEFSCEMHYAHSIVGGESVNPDKAREIILSGIKKATLREDEFERCKKVLIGDFLRLFNSVEGLSNAFVSSLFKNVDIFEFPSICEAITLTEAQDRLKNHFNEKNSVMSVIRPY
ncbi:MAG: insulinase family protein [Clostridiaceae bacterium]|nr:insulinase family protein [Clostridiaceae bacterium]